MKQLTTTDGLFLSLESDRTPMQIGILNIYESNTADNKLVRFKDVLNNFQSRLPLTPALRRKLKKTPLGIDSPYWIDDDAFDLEYHVRHIALPKPGDWRQLCILASRIWSRGLDLSRPPWEVYIIEGLDNVEGVPPGSFAMLFKMHHSACDGMSTTDIMSRLHTSSPTSEELYHDTFDPEPPPSDGELLVRAYVNVLKSPMSIYRRYQALKETPLSTGKLRELPEIQATRFNQRIAANRVLLTESFDLKDLKEIKNAVEGATLNDVVIAIISGALISYLKDKDELPETTMTCGIPMSTRIADDKMGGNKVNFMFGSMCSDIEDPIERLKAIHKDVLENKNFRDAMRVRQQSELVDGLPSALLSMGTRVAMTEAVLNRAKPAFTTLVTNVPGPQQPLYFCGAKMINMLGLGCPADNMGLFHTVTSYCGSLSINPMSCREMMPDPDFYGKCLRESKDELHKAALAYSASLKRAKPKAVRKTKGRTAKPRKAS